MFADKLSLLMTLTSTPNTELANILALDSSSISRFKLGTRIPPKDSDYVLIISKYLANKIEINNLKNKISAFIDIDNNKELFESIFIWLNSEYKYKYNNNLMCFYGDEGKQEATIQFLQNILKKTDETLFLYSDEKMDWLLDRDFSEKWSILLQDILKRGNRIKIIHSLYRNYSELFQAVIKWLPLYFSGNIEAYYYPNLRDNITRRTLFISSKEAIISNSVENKTKNMLNMYIKDTKAVESVKEEYNNYLELCRPLLKKEHINSIKDIYNLFEYEHFDFNINGLIIDIYIKEEQEVLVTKDKSNVILKSTEYNLVKAFYEHYLIYKDSNRKLNILCQEHAKNSQQCQVNKKD